jgi:hypothetical protein
MKEELRKVPFECRGCWHVWEEEFLVREVEGRNGGEVWLRGGVPVPPPSTAEICPKCGCNQTIRFPEGYLARHPEVFPAQPTVSDPTPLISPVPKRRRWIDS